MPTVNIKDITEPKIVRLVDLSEDSVNKIAEAVVRKIAVDAVPVVRCKDCKYFLYDKIYEIDGLPLMGNLVCEKWGNGCHTDENGYCFLGERR